MYNKLNSYVYRLGYRKAFRGEKMKIRGKQFFIAILSLALLLQTAPSYAFAAEPEAVNDLPVSGDVSVEQEDPARPENAETDKEQVTEDKSEEGKTGPDTEAEKVTGPVEEDGPTETEKTGEGERVEEKTDVPAEEPEEDLTEKELPEEEIAEAEERFLSLADEKNLMALVYLTDACPVYEEPDSAAFVSATLESATTVYLKHVKITKDGVFYYGSFFVSQEEKEGYIEDRFLARSDEDWRAWEESYADLLGRISPENTEYLNAGGEYADVLQFPAGYQANLNKLKNSHPNWTFVPMNTGLDFNTAVNSEMGDKSWIYINDSNRDKGYVGASTAQGNWAYATRAAVSYYMDPRNFLTESYIFQFEQLTFNSSYHNVNAIQNFLNNTFMKGVLPDQTSKTYAQAFFEIGKSQGVSPTHLASRVYQEQGKGTSPLISGTYSGYEGYYNYFNVGATGKTTTDVIVNGLTYAKNKGWNTRYKSLQGGASTIGNNYIKKGQDTGYLQKFNVNPNAANDVFTHQYMQNIQAPTTESTSTRKVYNDAGALSSAFVFKIPIFSNMPGLRLSKTSTTMNVGDQITLIASVNGTAVDAGKVTWSSSDTNIAKVTNGVVTAYLPGTVTIRAAYDGNVEECRINVKNPLKAIALDHASDIMRRNDTIVENGTGLSSEDKKHNHDSLQLNVTYEPENTTDAKTVIWSSSNTKVATVDANGLVKAKSSGTAVITAKASVNASIRTTCEVTVIAPVYQAALTGGGELLCGQSMNLSFEYWPKDTTSDITVTWKSSKPKVVGVKNGTVTGLGIGEAVITASIAGYSGSCQVKVTGCDVIFHGEEYRRFQNLVYGEKLGEQFTEKGYPWPDDPVQDGKIFLGWRTGEDGGLPVTKDTVLSVKQLDLYPYYEDTGKGFFVQMIPDQVYTGSAIRPEVNVYDSAEGETSAYKLEQGTDYTLGFAGNVKPGNKTATVTVKGKGNYAGSQTVKFTIVQKELTDPDIEISPAKAAFTGSAIRSNPVIIRNGKRLVNGTDYTLTYPQSGSGAYISPGTYPVIVTGKGGYRGTVTVYETITKAVNLSAVTVNKIKDREYTGAVIEPEVKLTYKGRELEKSNDNGLTGDYTISYQNNTNIGTATAVITGVNGYFGTKTVSFKIKGQSIAKAKIVNLQAKRYTGLETHGQDFVSFANDDQPYVTLNGTVLTYSADNVNGDYTAEYQKAEKAGTATVILKGINGYTGTLKKTYKILAYDLKTDSEDRIGITYHTAEDPDQEIAVGNMEEISCQYCKGGAFPEISLYDNADPVDDKPRKLLKGKDYRVSFTNSTNLSDPLLPVKKQPAVTITGIGNYSGKLTGNYTILASDFSADKVKITAADKVYKASKNAWKAVPVLTDLGGKKLKAGTDYDDINYTYALLPDPAVKQYKNEPAERFSGEAVGALDLPDAGTVIRVTVTGKGKYADEVLSCTYRIVKADLSAAKFKVNAKVYANGKPLALSESDIVYIRVGGNDLTFGEDYVIDESTYSYPAGWGKGKVSVTIRAKDDSNYGGTKILTYTIGSRPIVWWRNLL